MIKNGKAAVETIVTVNIGKYFLQTCLTSVEKSISYADNKPSADYKALLHHHHSSQNAHYAHIL